MKSAGSSPRGMDNQDLEEFYSKVGESIDFSPQTERMFFDFMGYLTTRTNFTVGRSADATVVLQHYSDWRKIWPAHKKEYEEEDRKMRVWEGSIEEAWTVGISKKEYNNKPE